MSQEPSPSKKEHEDEHKGKVPDQAVKVSKPKGKSKIASSLAPDDPTEKQSVMLQNLASKIHSSVKQDKKEAEEEAARTGEPPVYNKRRDVFPDLPED